MTRPVCDPTFMQYRDVTDVWVVDCPCGYRTEWATAPEASADRDRHAEQAEPS